MCACAASRILAAAHWLRDVGHTCVYVCVYVCMCSLMNIGSRSLGERRWTHMCVCACVCVSVRVFMCACAAS